jgi:hypothetical protein
VASVVAAVAADVVDRAAVAVATTVVAVVIVGTDPLGDLAGEADPTIVVLPKQTLLVSNQVMVW